MRRKNTPTVVTESADERKYRELVEGIASNITTLAKAVGALLHGPLKKRTLVLLLAHSSTQSQRTVEAVLTALENLQADWLNK